MSRKLQNQASSPAAVVENARRLGANIAVARRRRRLSQADLAAKAGISRPTLIRVEAGELGTALGAYTAVLWALGLDRDVPSIASPETDREGVTLEVARLGKRMHTPRSLSDDF